MKLRACTNSHAQLTHCFNLEQSMNLVVAVRVSVDQITITINNARDRESPGPLTLLSGRARSMFRRSDVALALVLEFERPRHNGGALSVDAGNHVIVAQRPLDHICTFAVRHDQGSAFES
jgi:hypothetical protein